MAYVIRARRSGEWWAIDVPEVPGVHSQARRIEQVEAMGREALALALDVEDPAGLEVELCVEYPSGWAPLVEQLRVAQAQARAAAQQLAACSRATAEQLQAFGLPVRDVAAVMGISPQRVSQLLHS